ncbi:cytochrome c peroxidase [alpha proteobacterium U9-1i]|nr:cytochrome c peroxidase [alpha proteobacterium U9-1i]
MKHGFFAVALVLIGAAGPSAPPLLLREQAWTASGANLAHTLTHHQSECLARRDQQIEIGRALFRSPALLGGPAARAGLSCHACHSNGGMNTAFLLPELTDRPGHADVTSEWASATLGDGVSNPIAIPDLAGASGKSSFGRLQVASLEQFTRNVIEQEFQGETPPAQAFDGVLSYMRALRLSACPAEAESAITLASAADDVRRAINAAREADAPTRSLLLLSAQDAVGRIVERLPAARFRRERSRLEGLARDAGAARDASDPIAALETTAWSTRFDAVIAQLARDERRTYFNEPTLARALHN